MLLLLLLLLQWLKLMTNDVEHLLIGRRTGRRRTIRCWTSTTLIID